MTRRWIADDPCDPSTDPSMGVAMIHSTSELLVPGAAVVLALGSVTSTLLAVVTLVTVIR